MRAKVAKRAKFAKLARCAKTCPVSMGHEVEVEAEVKSSRLKVQGCSNGSRASMFELQGLIVALLQSYRSLTFFLFSLYFF